MILDHSHLTEQELIDALSQLQHLRHELKILDGRVADLERAVNYRKHIVVKMMDQGESWENITRFIGTVFEVYQVTMLHVSECMEQYSRLVHFIYSVPDSQMRRILYERYINGLPWKAVAFEIKEYDEQYPRRLHNKFIAEYVRKHNSMYQT